MCAAHLSENIRKQKEVISELNYRLWQQKRKKLELTKSEVHAVQAG